MQWETIILMACVVSMTVEGKNTSPTEKPLPTLNKLVRTKRELPILGAILGTIGKTVIGVGTGILGAKAGVHQGLLAGRAFNGEWGQDTGLYPMNRGYNWPLNDNSYYTPTHQFLGNVNGYLDPLNWNGYLPNTGYNHYGQPNGNGYIGLLNGNGYNGPPNGNGFNGLSNGNGLYGNANYVPNNAIPYPGPNNGNVRGIPGNGQNLLGNAQPNDQQPRPEYDSTSEGSGDGCRTLNGYIYC